MAGNLKGLSGIKGLVLRHGEKVVIALVGFVALWLVYKSTSLPKLEADFQAEKLAAKISQTNLAVNDAKWPEPTSELAKEVYRAQPIDAKADNTVNVQAYLPPAPQGIDAPIVTPTIPREDPKLLNPVEVRAVGGTGLVAFIDEKIRKEQQLRMAADAEAAYAAIVDIAARRAITSG